MGITRSDTRRSLILGLGADFHHAEFAALTVRSAGLGRRQYLDRCNVVDVHQPGHLIVSIAHHRAINDKQRLDHTVQVIGAPNVNSGVIATARHLNLGIVPQKIAEGLVGAGVQTFSTCALRAATTVPQCEQTEHAKRNHIIVKWVSFHGE